jgi:hypothetical protein
VFICHCFLCCDQVQVPTFHPVELLNMTPDHKLVTLQEVFLILFQCHIHAVSYASNKHVKLVSSLADKLWYNFFIHKRTVLFWVITERVVISCRRFGTTNLAHIQGVFLHFVLTPEDGTDSLSRNAGKKLPLHAAH